LRIIADLHIHSHYSRATSERMMIPEIVRYSKIKGLNLVGTGDFTHPEWIKELRRAFTYDTETSLYTQAEDPQSNVHFIVSTEVSTIFTANDETKKVHHVILTPNIETAQQINEKLRKHGNLTVDGRPTLSMTPPQLVEEVMQTSSDNMIFPAHAWTPWFSVFGAFSGFNSIEDCYQDMTKHIHALETGLSSDPPMNWRLSKLDKLTLLSNSDSHSFWPWRIGREANCFELEKLSYEEIIDTIRSKDKNRFKFTIETDPAYGKYHWTGHRNCNVSLSPKEAAKLANICPVCRRKLTKGVEQRVEELADRPQGFKPENAIDYVRLLPLSEIITTVLNVDSPYSQRVWKVYNPLIERFGNEYNVLLDASTDEINKTVDPNIADAIIRVRSGNVTVVPGYDGVYGRLVLSELAAKSVFRRVQQVNLADYM
jgi:uncharacterized protein (TIGR00375 family)